MRIAFFSETFLPKIDGIVNTLCYLLDYLAVQGYRSILFAPDGGPARYARTQVIGLPGIAFPLYPELKLVPPHFDISDQLMAFRPDLIHLLNPFSLGLLGLNLARRLKIPVVASYHTDIPGFVERWGFGTLREPFRAYLRWLHNQADLTLCPSQTTQIELNAHGFERIKVWGRGVDTQRFKPQNWTEAWRVRLSGGHPELPLLLYVGRLSPEKRVNWLRPVLAAMPGTRLAIVGDGPARSELETVFAGTPTIFTGYLRGHDLACAYAAADIFVFPGANETLGNVVLEAMASGLPVVAPGSGGVMDHIIEGQTGLLFNPNSQAELVAAVRQVVINKSYAQQLGLAGRIYAQSKSWNQIFDQLLADYYMLYDSYASSRIPIVKAA